MSNKENAFSRLARELIGEFAATRPIHANTLLLSIYGDTVCPYGGTIWLGSLIKLVGPLGINQRLVRTSVFRLSEKGILQSHQNGRRSYYTLTERGLRHFQSASKRIYAKRTPHWDGSWLLIMTSLGGLDPEQREAVRRELIWLGFSRLATGIYAHPNADMEGVKNMLADREFGQHIALLHADTTDSLHADISNRLIKQCFNTHSMDEQYQEFTDTFQPLLEAARKAHKLDPQLSFLVRTLLIHKYRYILLKEPELPHELLPSDAITHHARQITEQLYLRLRESSDEHFLQLAESESGAFKGPKEPYLRRFLGPQD